MERGPGYSEAAGNSHVPMDVASLYERAACALRARLRVEKELTPRQVARTVCGALPRHVAGWLWQTLDALGWLEPEARIPADALDSPGCPPELGGRHGALARLAIFGLEGQGRPTEAKHREAVYQQICAEILREAQDHNTLLAAEARALHHPDVRQDAILAGMIQSFLSERRADIASKSAERQSPESALRQPFKSGEARAPRGTPAPEQVLAGFERLRIEFDERLAGYDLTSAQAVLERIAAMHQRYPDVISLAVVERCKGDLVRVEQRRLEYEQEIQTLRRTAIRAAQRGDHDTAAQALRRLSGIHADRPHLLSDARFQKIRDEIAQGSAVHEHRLTARELVSRERAVAAEIMRLAEVIHRYHEVAGNVAHDSEDFRRAATEYERCVEQVRSRDSEWLAELMLELDALLSDLHDPTGRAEAQVDRFLKSVRAALGRLQKEIRQIQREQAEAS